MHQSINSWWGCQLPNGPNKIFLYYLSSSSIKVTNHTLFMVLYSKCGCQPSIQMALKTQSNYVDYFVRVFHLSINLLKEQFQEIGDNFKIQCHKQNKGPKVLHPCKP